MTGLASQQLLRWGGLQTAGPLDGLEVIRGEVICLALLCRIEGQSLKDPSVTPGTTGRRYRA
jgi:hypothetical protein